MRVGLVCSAVCAFGGCTTLSPGQFGALPADEVRVPLMVRGGQILVRATINGQSGWLLLDTGSSAFLVNSGRVPLPSPVPISVVRISTFTGTHVWSRIYRLDHVRWGQHTPSKSAGLIAGSDTARLPDGIALRGVHAVRADLTSIERNLRLREPLLGLLGAPQLEPFLAIFDYRARMLTLYPVDAAGRPRSSAPRSLPPAVTLSIMRQGKVPSFQTTVGGRQTTFLFDTGANLTNLDSVTAATLAIRVTHRATHLETGLAKETKSAYHGDIPRLMLGGLVIDTLHVSVLEDVSKEKNLLGHNFWARQRWALNLRAKTLTVWPVS